MGHIEEVAARLKGLREALGLSVADVCAACGIEEEKYTAYEHGTTGIPVSTAKRIAEAYGVEIMALLFGDEPKMNSYYITRKGSGETVERRDWYKYQSLAAGFFQPQDGAISGHRAAQPHRRGASEQPRRTGIQLRRARRHGAAHRRQNNDTQRRRHHHV